MKIDNLPQKWNLYKFTGLPYFKNWPEGAEVNRLYEEKKREYEEISSSAIAGRAGTIGWGVSFFTLGFCGLKLFAYDWLLGMGAPGFTFSLAILPAIFLIIWYQHEKKEKAACDNLDWAKSKSHHTICKYTDIFIEPLADKLMSGCWRSFRTGMQCIIYGEDGFIYFSTRDSTLVAYDKSNIKDVTRERVHIGAATNSQVSGYTSTYAHDDYLSTGVRASSNTSTSGYSNTTNYYEWHLDVFTDFVEYPKVSLVLDDISSTENFIGEIYAVLSPKGGKPQ